MRCQFGYLSLAFDPPGILVRARPSEEHQGGIVVMRDVYPHDTARLREKGEGTVGRKFHIDSSKLIQLLAKIAHSFSVAEFGLNTFDPFLIDIVLGRSPNFPHYYVGGEFFVSPDFIHLHELS